MSIFKRLSATIVSRVDQLVTEIEDHDAVVESVIKTARQAVAKSKVRLAQMKSEGGRLRCKLAEVKQVEKKWGDRAREVASQDEDKAIQCLRQRQNCQRQSEELNCAIEKHQALEERLVRDVQAAESRVMEITQQRKLMRTRQSAAEALNVMNTVDENMLSEVSAAFERWEINITEEEMEAGTYVMDDTLVLEQEFIDAEEKTSLLLELHEMLASKEANNERA